MTSILSSMHQASLIAPNIIVTTGCSSSHSPLAGPSSTLCLAHAPLHSCTLTHNRHAHFLFLPNAHFSWLALGLHLLLISLKPSFLSLQPYAAVRVHKHKMLNSAANFSLVCVKKPGQTKSFHLFPHCLHWLMKVPLKIFDSSTYSKHREQRILKGLQCPAVVVEKWHTTLLSHHAVSPAGLNSCPALHFHPPVCLRACLHGKIIAHKAGMWINITSLQRALQVQWGLVCTRTLLWRQPRCKSPLPWHQLPQTHCQCLQSPPRPSWAP